MLKEHPGLALKYCIEARAHYTFLNRNLIWSIFSPLALSLTSFFAVFSLLPDCDLLDRSFCRRSCSRRTKGRWPPNVPCWLSLPRRYQSQEQVGSKTKQNKTKKTGVREKEDGGGGGGRVMFSIALIVMSTKWVKSLSAFWYFVILNVSMPTELFHESL